MIDVHSVEFYVIAFAVAFGLFGLVFGRHDREPGATVMAPLRPLLPNGIADTDTAATVSVTTALPDTSDATGTLTLTALPNGDIRLRRTAVPLRPGETAYVAATVVDDRLNIVEKTGERGRSGLMAVAGDCEALLQGLPQRRLYVRYDSEITGQWATVGFTNTEGREATAELRY